MANTTSNRRVVPAKCVVMWSTLCTMTRQNLTRESRSVNKGTSFFGDRKVAAFVSLSMPFNQHCSAIYVWSKLYLVFKISSDIMTKHCCQICVLSMIFCHSDSRLCADKVSDGAIGKLEYHVVLTTLRQANAGNDMKNILYDWFSHFRDTSVIELFPVVFQ